MFKQQERLPRASHRGLTSDAREVPRTGADGDGERLANNVHGGAVGQAADKERQRVQPAQERQKSTRSAIRHVEIGPQHPRGRREQWQGFGRCFGSRSPASLGCRRPPVLTPSPMKALIPKERQCELLLAAACRQARLPTSTLVVGHNKGATEQCAEGHFSLEASDAHKLQASTPRRYRWLGVVKQSLSC